MKKMGIAQLPEEDVETDKFVQKLKDFLDKAVDLFDDSGKQKWTEMKEDIDDIAEKIKIARQIVKCAFKAGKD